MYEGAATNLEGASGGSRPVLMGWARLGPAFVLEGHDRKCPPGGGGGGLMVPEQLDIFYIWQARH